MSDQAKTAVRMRFNLQRFAEEGGDDGQEPQPIVIDGVEYTPDQLKEFISKGKDYTKKTQDLANQRKQFEAQSTEYERLKQYSGFIESLESDPNLAQAVITTVQGYTPGQGTAPTQNQINTIKNAVEDATDDDVRQKLEDIQLSMEIDKLKSKFDDFDEEAVLQYAADEGISDLEKAYKLLNYDAHQEKAAKRALEGAKKGAQVPKTLSGNNGTTPGSQVTKPKTFGEASRALEAHLANQRE